MKLVLFLAVGIFCATANALFLAHANAQPAPAAAAATPVASPLQGVNQAPAAPTRRPWDPAFLDRFHSAPPGRAITFELVSPEVALGTLHQVHHAENQVVRVAGVLSAPEPGRFFFQRQTAPGKAGAFVGVVEFPGSETAYRLEPAISGQGTELVLRALGEVLCLRMPAAPSASGGQTEEIPPLRPSEFPNVPIPDYQRGIIVLESLPGARAVVYLDFQGGYTDTWGGITYARPSLSNAQIKDVWVRVAEDYMPFQINVTTDLKVYHTTPEESRQRVIITPTSTAAPGAGGVAFIGSFNWTGDTPCWVFQIGGKDCAEAISHEVGHTLGLRHDGADVNGRHTEYFSGHGLGDTGWAPIMGVGYSQNVVQWSKGEYLNANNQEDDLEIIVTDNNEVRYRPDDAGAAFASARHLDVLTNFTVRAQGVIEDLEDADAFRFATDGGPVTLRVDPVNPGPNLALGLALYDAMDRLVAENVPPNTLGSTLSTNLTAGAYRVLVSAAGRNNPLINGFSTYGSRGLYTLSGSIAGGCVTDLFSVPEHTPAGTVLGTLNVPNPESRPLRFNIRSGNLADTFAIDDSGALRIRDATLLDYETLARPTQLPVRFELFLDIQDDLTGTVLEASRRVVIEVTDVNDPPQLEGFSVSLFTSTRAGTSIGTLAGSDPDFYNLITYAIDSGNDAALFTLDAATGEIFLARPLPADGPASYRLVVSLSDGVATGPLTATAEVLVQVLPAPVGLEPGGISYTVYTNIPGNLISALTAQPAFPFAPRLEQSRTSFEAPRDRGDHFGAAFRGYLLPPVTGSYLFWIASDDNSELLLSDSSSTSPLRRVAQVAGDGSYTAFRQWDKYPSQRSASVWLQAGQAYYVEARHKEGGGNDHLSVAWECAEAGLTRQVIPGRYLAPQRPNLQPVVDGLNVSVHRNAIRGTRVGRVVATDFNPQDRLALEIVAGSLGEAFAFDPLTGDVRVADEAALLNSPQSSFSATVRATDNGAPPRSAEASVRLTLVAPDAVTATGLYQEIWTNLGTGTLVQSLTNNNRYPRRPDALVPVTDLQGARDRGEAYGSRLRGRVRAASTGQHHFFLSSDDTSLLRVSTNAEPAFATQVVTVTTATDFQRWNQFSTQRSPAFTLQTGQEYYFDVLHKEGTGGDHVSVAWTRPGVAGTNLIEASSLVPVDLNFPPVLFGQAVQVPLSATNGSPVATLRPIDSVIDTFTFKIQAGNFGEAFAIDPDTGTVTVANRAALPPPAPSVFQLEIVVQDAGYGGLFPRKSTSATLSVNVIDDAPVAVWTGGGADANWSTAANWEANLPAEGMTLRFGPGQQQTSRNDLLASAGLVTLDAGGFYLSGNPLRLLAGLSSTGDNTWAIDSQLAGPQTFVSPSGRLDIAGDLDTAGHTLTLAAQGIIIVSGHITGAGDVLKSGNGAVALAAGNTFSGSTRITGGTLRLTDSAALGGTSSLEVHAGALLDVSALNPPFALAPQQRLFGQGAISGPIVVSGTIEPGGPYGALTFSNAVVLTGTTRFLLGPASDGWTNGLLRVRESLTFGGSLVLTQAAGAFAPGQVLRLFEAAEYRGAFDRLQLPALDASLLWDTTSLGVDGTLRVGIAPPTLAYRFLPGQGLEIEVPTASGINYELQSSDRLTPDAIWERIALASGGAGPLKVTVPVTPGNPVLFLRVVARP